MKKMLNVFLLLIIVLGLTSGCGKKEEKKEKIAILNTHDYYINYYNNLVKEDYKSEYAAYLYTTSFGTKEDFKNNYHKRRKEEYTFLDIDNDGTEEFILITYYEKNDYFKQDYKMIDIYTIDLKTKEIRVFLSSMYHDNLYYNADKNIYLTKITNETGTTGTYEIISYDIEDKAYKTKEGLNFNDETQKYYKIGDNGGKYLTVTDIQNSEISLEEYLSYISNLKEIKLDIHNINEIYDDYIDDKLLEEIEMQIKEYEDNNSKDLKCTNKDVDNIVNLLLSGNNVMVDKNSDIKFNSKEIIQYNPDYPKATIYTISCGKYSKSVRISHK